MAKRRKSKKPANMGGELPNEYLRRSLVPVRILMLAAEGRITDDHYIVKTTRLDNQWRVVVEHGAESMMLPHKVVEQIARHRDSIIKAQRHNRALERVQQIIGA